MFNKHYLHVLQMIRIDQPPPWKHIFLSGPVLALLLLKFLDGWVLHSLLSTVTLYLYNVVNISVTYVSKTLLWLLDIPLGPGLQLVLEEHFKG